MKPSSHKLVLAMATGSILVMLPACAGHRELKAPCSASTSPWFLPTGRAYAAQADCGPIHPIGMDTVPAAHAGTEE